MRSRTTLLAVLCAAALLTLAGTSMLSRLYPLQSIQTMGRVLPYSGRFAEEPACRKLARRLPALLERATQTAATGLGLPADSRRFRIRLVDNDAGHGFVARTIAGTYGPIVIELRLEPLLSRRIDLEQTLVHEAAHAVLANALGPGYASLPEWLREGLAADLAGETELNLSRAISRTRLRPVERILNGVSRSSNGTSDYGENGLAIETLRSLAGDDAVPRLVSCLTGGDAWIFCLKDLTGLRPKRFEARAMIDALATVHDLAGDRVSGYESARARLRNGSPAEALEALDAFLALGPGPFDREASLDSARALSLLERHGEALDRVEALLARGNYGPELGLEAFAFKAEANRRAGRPEQADRACRELLLYYGQNGSAGRAECAITDPTPVIAASRTDRP